MIGSVVRSTAGRDKGCILVVIGCDASSFFVCDGKRHRLTAPKRKNPKHLFLTGCVLEKEKYATDKSLRRALACHRCAEDQKEEFTCQKRI